MLASYEYTANKGGESSHVYAHTSQGVGGETSVTVSVQQDSVYILDVSIYPFSRAYANRYF
jgi:hypothetical protein